MNTSSPRFFFRAALASFFALAPALFAQEPAVAVEKPAAVPAAPAAPAAPVAPEVPAPPAAAAEPAVEITPPPTGTPEAGPRPPRRNSHRTSGGDFPFGDHVVSKGSRIRDAVSIFGSTTIEGEVDSDAVSVLGNTVVGREAKVNGAVVAVLGQVESQGEIRRDVVSVLGGVDLDGLVHGKAVSVLGNLHLGPHAVVDGDLVIVGGELTKDAGAVVRGNEVRVPVFGPFGSVEWLTTWLTRCLFLGRLLAFGPHLGWAWAVAASFLAFYLLLALLFSRGIVTCAEILETRPGYSILASVLTVMLTPVVIVLLAVTVVGALLVPFLGAGLAFAKLFGTAAMLAWIGRRFTKFFGDGPLSHPVFAVLVGGVVVMGLYTVPVLGLLTYKLLSWLGLGVVVHTLALSMRREKAPAVSGGQTGSSAPTEPLITPVTTESPMATVASVAPTVSAVPLGAVAPSSVSTDFSGANVGAVEMTGLPDLPPAPPLPPVGEMPAPVVPPAAAPVTPPIASSFRTRPPVAAAVMWPRAGFLLRLWAMLLDLILVAFVLGFGGGMLPHILHFSAFPGGLLLALAIYGAVMWKLKGTTIGGIICGLKVVRLDDREIDWGTAIVRALSCFLSLVVVGLGFIWVEVDDDKQSWHDKVAGTTVVRVPKGTSLL